MAGEQQGGGGGSPRVTTPEQRVAEREVYAGAQDAGVKIAGLAEVTEYEDSFAGSKDNPVAIGQKITVTVRVAADGTLLPRRENSDESTPPATSILTIDVIPSVEFDSSGAAHVIWNGHASQVDVGNARVITSSLSGPSREEETALAGDRPSLEYGNDPAYIDGTLELRAGSRAEAVTQALGPLVSSGRMNVGRDDRVPVDEPQSKRRAAKVVAAVAVPLVIAAATFGIISRGDGDQETVTDTSPAEAEDVDDTGSAEDTDTSEVTPPAGDAASGDVTPAEDTSEPANDSAAEDTSPAPGTYEISGRIDGPCGSYDVFLRVILFLDGQITLEQLLTAGGNAFQTASGRWGPGLAVGQSFQPDLFEVWMILMLSDALSVYNVYGPSAAGVSADAELDPSRFADVASAEALADAVEAAVGYCAAQLLDVITLYTAFPG